MANVIVRGQVYLGEVDMTGQANAVAINYSANATDNTTYGDDTTTMAAGGVKQFDASIEGYWNGTEEGVLFADVGTDTVLTAVNGTGVVGDPAFCLPVVLGASNSSGAHGELLAYNASMSSRGNMGRGMLGCNATLVSSGSQAGVELGAVSATQKLVASLHVISASAGDTIDVIIESDVNDSWASPTTVLTFTQAAAATSEIIEVDGAITDTWFRVTYVIAGDGGESFAAKAAIGIAF
jgi:hypothetical protein